MKLLDVMNKAIRKSKIGFELKITEYLWKCKHANKTIFHYYDVKWKIIEDTEVCTDCGKTLGITRKVIE